MPAIVCLLRAINVGGHNQIKMDSLRALCESLGLKGVQTYIQSGNVVFTSKERNLTKLARQIEDAIERKFGFRPDVVLRTTSELRDLMKRNPFVKRPQLDPAKIVVTFLATRCDTAVREAVLAIEADSEEVHLHESEVFIYFPDGMGKSKLVPKITKALKNAGTARNWNSVTRLLEMAEAIEK